MCGGRNRSYRRRESCGLEEAYPYGEEEQSDICADTVSYLIEMIKYKGEAAGIRVVVCEEAIQSKASSIDEDQIPVYGNDVTHTFTGKRIKRGLYRSKNGILMNADINGASNIIRKVYPCMPERERWSRGTVNVPVTCI